MIVVTAVGGSTGTSVVRALLARVRAVVPSRRPRPELDGLDAEIVLGNLTGDLSGVRRLVYHSVHRPQARAMSHHAANDRVEGALDGAVAGTAARWRVLQP